MTDLDRLLTEAIPDGTFGHAVRPARQPRRCTPLEQEQHRADLLAELQQQPRRPARASG